MDVWWTRNPSMHNWDWIGQAHVAWAKAMELWHSPYPGPQSPYSGPLVFKCTYDWSWLATHSNTTLHVNENANIHECSRVFMWIHKCSRVFISVHECSQVFTNVHEYSCVFLWIPVNSCVVNHFLGYPFFCLSWCHQPCYRKCTTYWHMWKTVRTSSSNIHINWTWFALCLLNRHMRLHPMARSRCIIMLLQIIWALLYSIIRLCFGMDHTAMLHFCKYVMALA